MVWTIFRVALTRLLHNRVELLLTFIVPIAFFSIFAVIFGRGLGGSNTPKIKTVIVDTVSSQQSEFAVDKLQQLDSLRVFQPTKSDAPLTVAQAENLVRRGMVTIAVVLEPATAGDALSSANNALPTLRASLLLDTSDQVASQMMTALVQQTLSQANQLPQPAAVRFAAATYRPPNSEMLTGETISAASQLVEVPNLALVDSVDVLSESKANPVVSMYAAGIAVMFLLFGASGGGASLLEERENTTLERLLTTRLSMDQLLLGKWAYQTALGVIQVTVMFIWGWLIFQVDLWSHLDGFLLMTVVTAGAASSFGLLLATVCRTRGQLNGVSVILILTMSALGGSMVPRYIMSDAMRETGLYTFNAWALDGYDKVFWRELPVADLWPQICVLMLASAGMLLVARLLAIRWETN
ncbi:ABC transporter permease [Planctomycetaceae bacterium SH139]